MGDLAAELTKADLAKATAFYTTDPDRKPAETNPYHPTSAQFALWNCRKFAQADLAGQERVLRDCEAAVDRARGNVFRTKIAIASYEDALKLLGPCPPE